MTSLLGTSTDQTPYLQVSSMIPETNQIFPKDALKTKVNLLNERDTGLAYGEVDDGGENHYNPVKPKHFSLCYH